MTALLRATLFQLTILRRRAVVLGGVGIAAALTALITLATVLNAGSGERGGPPGQRRQATTLDQLAQASGSVQGVVNARFLLGLVALVIGASALATPFSLGTLRVLLVREPRRVRLLGGLVLGSMVVVALTAVVCVVVGIAMAYALAPGKGVDTSQWLTGAGFEAIGRTTGQAALAFVGYAGLGCVLAVLLRTPVASIAIGLVYLAIVETLVQVLLWDKADQWLPGFQLQAVLAGGSGTASSFGRAIGLAAVYAVVLGAGTSLLFRRRDVSL